MSTLATIAGWLFAAFVCYVEAIRTGEVCGLDGACQMVTTPAVTPGWIGYFTVLFWMTLVIVVPFLLGRLYFYAKEKMRVRKFAKWCMDNDRDSI